MVICNMDAVVIPTPPALPPPLKGSSVHSRKNSSSYNGFRLQDHPQHQQDDAGSVYSIYKQKIDSMFESDSSSKDQNCVQARIEKMFCDVAKDNGIPASDIGCHSFSVDYMGSVPLQEKVTSLAGLQNPLRELYFSYKKSVKHKKQLTGRLEISSGGLKVQYQGEKGDLEQLNSFPTIAVWSAVKFVMQGNQQPSYAFLPLITDPDNLDKQQLFRSIDPNEKKLVSSEIHSPLFAVVMRKIGANKQLECHGFICQTSEDAIVIAATLYKALMAHMKAKEKRPKNKNGVTCMSMTSSIYNEPPVRPPRRKRSTTSSVKSGTSATMEGIDTLPPANASTPPKEKSKHRKSADVPEATPIDLDAIVPYEETRELQDQEEITEIKPQPLLDKFNTYRSNHQKQITAEIKQVMNESVNMGLKRVKSVRKRAEDSGLVKENSGDILTKVTIPRSGSFLNAGGLTRYKSKVQRNNGQATGGSPLGFSELFNEFRLQEGLHSVDEILGVIIDPEGMSFNDLKPIYKEFLLKLALTLTKDELYQRSKLIMRRHKKKLLRSNSVHSKKGQVPVYNKFKRLKHIFQKIKLAKENKLNPPDLNETDAKLPESSISSSSYDTRHFKPKEVKISRKQSYKRRSTNKSRRGDRVSTSEESDFFSLRRKRTQHTNSNQNRNSSSGYVSCSECSYDSDTCTCISADKCYCSLGNKNCKCIPESVNKKLKCCCGNEKADFIWCGCDTDSCTDSNKCYCSFKKEKSTIFEQLKQRGFIPSSGTITTPPNHRKLCKKNSNTKSTKSLEYMSNPSEKYYEKLKRSNSKQKKKRNSYTTDNLAVDYELFSIANGRICNIAEARLYGRNSVDSENKGSSRSSVKSLNSHKFNQSRNTLQTTAIPVKACTEALSVKKSAEIAALFADIKLSQTTDIAHLIPKQIDPEVVIAYKNAYNRRPASRCSSRMERIEKIEGQQYSNRMVNNNTLYSSKVPKSNMYSARNGLYTIQSQSDDSRSSLERGTNRRKGEYRPQIEEKKSVSTALENSLGYLP